MQSNYRKFLICGCVAFSLQAIASVESESPENQLTIVRSHLLALGKTEGQLKELRDKTVDGSSTTTEYSIVEVLQLWQKIFQDTFHQYHRLSSRLVQSQDNASALKLWHEYLQHVQSFLASTIPQDYSSLTEHRHLCNVHENLLVSQKSVLELKSEKSNVDPNILEQFNSLTNLHNETLSRILERHTEIEKRLSAWDKYRKDQALLLEWLKEKERERSRLQLKYIHLRRVPKVLHRIERIIEQMPYGENETESLRKQQANFLQFCDDAIATSIRMEHAAIVQRISNLRAGLETWRDFLEKIVNLGKTYDEKVKSIQSNFQETQTLVTNAAGNLPTNSIDIQERLNQLRNQRVRLNNLIPELELISVIQEELKECISPFDMKTIRQMVWILWQQQADLDQQLSNLINQIEERLSLNEMFSAKHVRLMKWMDGIEKRLDGGDSQSVLLDAEDVIKKVEKEVQTEMELREHEREWLLFNGQELLAFYAGNTKKEKQIRQEIQTKIDTIVDRWERLKYLSKSRSNKINDLKTTMLRLEERIAEIRNWLQSMEIELAKPVVFENLHKSVVDLKLKEHDKLQRAIEGESSNIGDVLNLCEMLLSDVDTWKAHFNTTTLTSSVENLESRWKNVCSMSAERKRRIINTWSLLLELLQMTNNQEPWLVAQETDLSDLEQGLDELTKVEAQERITILEEKIIEIESRSSIFKSLEQTYSKLAKTNGLEPENIKHLTTSTRFMLIRWRALVPKALDIIGMLNMDMKMYREFISCQNRSMDTLTQIQSNYNKLTNNPADNPEDQLRQLQCLEQELKMCENDLANADKLGLVLMKKGRPDEIQSIQSLIDEYQLLWTVVNTSIIKLKTEVQTTINKQKEIDEGVQVETLRFESDSACQVNTLPGLTRMTSITPKDAYIYELAAAIKEVHSNLESLEKAVNDPAKKPGSQVVSKLISNSQSSVELMNHLSTLLITECFCTNEEAEVNEVAELCAQYETLVALWRAKERQQESSRLVVKRKKFGFGFSFLFLFYLHHTLLTPHSGCWSIKTFFSLLWLHFFFTKFETL